MAHFGCYDLIFFRKLLLSLLVCSLGCSPAFLPNSDIKARNIEVNESASADSTIVAMIRPYKTNLDREMKTVIGTARYHLDNHPGRGESILGNFVADLLLRESEKKYGEKIDMAIINSHGGLRTTISKGPITKEKIFELMPFENNMLVLELSGSLTQQFFDHCAKTLRNNVAGARFTIENDKAAGVRINGKTLDPNSSYTLAISDYLAEGGGGFGFLNQANRLANLNYKIRDMIIDHIKDLTDQNKMIEAQLDGRIKIIN
ncbi:MAG: 5'-nucleotidase C-terminal domain-containing protein [Cytophagales bacterium]|nr:5'-nucleotidase C-terminal domain-containing protein [Cytophagales bacterium]